MKKPAATRTSHRQGSALELRKARKLDRDLQEKGACDLRESCLCLEQIGEVVLLQDFIRPVLLELS
jgi:hypothetical protein